MYAGWSTPLHITFPAQLSCPALRRLFLRQFTLGGPFNLDCPSLEAFSFKKVIASVLPSGLDACNRLRVLKCSTLGSTDTGSMVQAWISAAVESVHSSLEELKLSGRSRSALPQCLSRCTRLQPLRACHTKLGELPSLPLSLRVVDLRNTEFQSVPTQLEKVTGLTSLRLYSSNDIVTGQFQITRDLRPIIRLPKLQLLELARDSNYPLYTVWTVQSLSYLGLAEHEIARSGSKLELKF